jgi:carbon starvation protein
MVLIFFSLTIVLAVFMFVIAVLFKMYPAAIFPVWMQIPIAVGIGYLMYEKKVPNLWLGPAAIALLYLLIHISASSPFLSGLAMPGLFGLSDVMAWILVLLAYSYIASVLPVHRLLQPRDFINGLQLFIILFLLVLGVLVMHPDFSAPAVRTGVSDAPPLFPILFITIACGAVSGFHSLVSSGTTAKQLDNEKHALPIGYGAMLVESLLAVLVIIAACAALGGREAWLARYGSWTAASGLGAKLSAFVDGSVNLLGAIGIPGGFGKAFMGVLIVSFAGTTLDSATRIQRYIVNELGRDLNIPVLTRVHPATAIAVFFAALLTFMAGGGKGGLLLWPLFGATNQLLAALAFGVVTVYLLKRGKPIWMTAVPAAAMVAVTTYALVLNSVEFLGAARAGRPEWHLLVLSVVIIAVEAWMVAEMILVLREKKKTPVNTI